VFYPEFVCLRTSRRYYRSDLHENFTTDASSHMEDVVKFWRLKQKRIVYPYPNLSPGWRIYAYNGGGKSHHIAVSWTALEAASAVNSAALAEDSACFTVEMTALVVNQAVTTLSQTQRAIKL